MSESSFREEMNSVDRWVAELKSLGLAAKRKNELKDAQELHTLSDNSKEKTYQEYKTAYSEAVWICLEDVADLPGEMHYANSRLLVFGQTTPGYKSKDTSKSRNIRKSV